MTTRPPVIFADTAKQARKLMDELYRDAYLQGKVTAVDSEFVPVTHEPVLMSYSWGRGIRRVVRAELVKEFFGEWLVDEQTKLAYQNYKEDVETFEMLGVPETELQRSFYIDTMVAGVLRDETLMKHGLKAQMLHFLKWFRREYGQLFCYVPQGLKKAITLDPRQVLDNLPPDALTNAVLKWGSAKGGHKTGPRTAEEWFWLMLCYAGDDAEGTQRLAVDHRRYLKETDYWDKYCSVDREFTLTLMQCEDSGAFLDQPVLRKILRKQQIRIMRAEHCFRTASGNPKLNLRSPPQMKKLLYEEWGWPEHPTVETPTGGLSMDKEVLQWWLQKHKLEMAEVKLAFNNATTMSGTFLTGLLLGVSDDGRLRSDLNQIGAKTSGRISSRKFEVLFEEVKTYRNGTTKTFIKKKKVGANLQNIPARKEKDPDGIRGAFRAPRIGETTAWGDEAKEEHVLAVADYSGFHLVLVVAKVAKLTKSSAMLDIMLKYKTPSAVHVYTTIEMFKHAKPHRCDASTCKDKQGNWKKFHGENKSFALKELTMTDWEMVKPLFPDQYTYAKNCVTGETMILTDRGYRRIDEICAGYPQGKSPAKPGLMIATRDGLRQVSDIYRAGRQPIKRVTTDRGLVIRANDSHDMPVVRDGRVVMVKVCDLAIGDLCLMKMNSNVHGSRTRLDLIERSQPMTSYRPIDLPTELTPQVARLIGYFVSEGYSAKHNTTYTTTFGFSALQDEDMIDDVERCLRAVARDRVQIYEDDKRDTKSFVVTSKDLYLWWRMLGCGEDSATKVIPNAILGAPWEFKRQFLRAYFAGDGSVANNTIKATSKSEQLIRQIQGELINVGIVANVSSHEVPGYGSFWSATVANGIYVRKFASMIGFSCERKQRLVEAIDSRERGSLVVDGFVDDVTLIKTDDQALAQRLNQVKRGACRLNETIIRGLTAEQLEGTQLGEVIRDDLWTVEVKSIESDGEEEVYDLYEPVHKVMIASGLLVGDTNFGLLFLGSPWTLAYNTGRDANDEEQLEECKRHFDQWFELYPEITIYQNHCIDHAYEHGWVGTIGGRRGHVRAYLEGCDRSGKYIQDEDKRKRMIKHGKSLATNIWAQGSEADIVKMAMNFIKKSKQLREMRFAPLFPVHDEVITEGPKRTSELALPEQVRLMKLPYKEEMGVVELAVEGACGPDWIRAKP